MFAIEILFLLGFPFLLASGTSYFMWGALSRPAVFLVVATVALYLLYAVLMWQLDPGLISFTVFIHEPGEVASASSEPWLGLLRPYKIPLAAFAAAAVPVLAVLLRAFKRGRGSEV